MLLSLFVSSSFSAFSVSSSSRRLSTSRLCNISLCCLFSCGLFLSRALVCAGHPVGNPSSVFLWLTSTSTNEGEVGITLYFIYRRGHNTKLVIAHTRRQTQNTHQNKCQFHASVAISLTPSLSCDRLPPLQHHSLSIASYLSPYLVLYYACNRGVE